MVEDLFRLNSSANISIIDNNSTYPPLLEWYSLIKNDVKIIRNGANLGPWTFFYSGHFSQVDSEVYVYSDADLELNPKMPYNWQEILLDNLNRYERKASLALRLDDVPDSYEFKEQIKDHQSICWYPTDEANVFRAITDMTFSMDKKSNGYRYESVRLSGDLACRHIPWYIDLSNMDEEEIFYLTHIDPKYSDAMYSRLHYRKLPPSN